MRSEVHRELHLAPAQYRAQCLSLRLKEALKVQFMRSEKNSSRPKVPPNTGLSSDNRFRADTSAVQDFLCRPPYNNTLSIYTDGLEGLDGILNTQTDNPDTLSLTLVTSPQSSASILGISVWTSLDRVDGLPSVWTDDGLHRQLRSGISLTIQDNIFDYVFTALPASLRLFHT